MYIASAQNYYIAKTELAWTLGMSEIELKSRVTQLEAELEQEKSKFNQFQQKKLEDEKLLQEQTKQQIVEMKSTFENDRENQIKVNYIFQQK